MDFEYSIYDYMEMVRMLNRCHNNVNEACLRFFIQFSDVPPPSPQVMMAARQWLINYGPPDIEQMYQELDYRNSIMRMKRPALPQGTPNKRRRDSAQRNNQNGGEDMETD
uniref:SFRICE_021591 n=1 Tax=Spodoptera frugiperda TaxID=7108 RepID=A0A2H1VJY8_SPOFR